MELNLQVGTCISSLDETTSTLASSYLSRDLVVQSLLAWRKDIQKTPASAWFEINETVNCAVTPWAEF